MYKLFPSTVASLTRKNPEDKREPRLQQVFFTDDDLWWQLQTWFCGWWQCLQQWWWRPKLQVCDDKSLEKAGPLIVVNLMKIKDPEALAKWVLSYEKVAPLIVINWMKISLLKFPLLSSLAFSLYIISAENKAYKSCDISAVLCWTIRLSDHTLSTSLLLLLFQNLNSNRCTGTEVHSYTGAGTRWLQVHNACSFSLLPATRRQASVGRRTKVPRWTSPLTPNFSFIKTF